jgi:hypothetical protein
LHLSPDFLLKLMVAARIILADKPRPTTTFHIITANKGCKQPPYWLLITNYPKNKR